MREKGLSQHQFASQLNVSQAYINKLLKRELFMSPQKALVIEQVTGLSARGLLILDVDFKLGELYTSLH